MRTVLTQDLIINLPLPGDPGNGTINNPWQSLQRAIDTVFTEYDLCGRRVTFKLTTGPRPAPGESLGLQHMRFYAGFKFSGRFVGQRGLGMHLKNRPGKPDFIIGDEGRVSIVGDPGHLHGAFIRSLTPTFGPCVSISEGASIYIDGVLFDNGPSQQDCVDVFHGSTLGLGNVHFGTAGDPSECNHLSIGFGSCVFLNGLVRITGAAASFCNVASGSALYWNNNLDAAYPMVVDIPSPVAMPRGFILADQAIAYPGGIAWNGYFNGPKAMVVRCGVVETAGAGIPGTMPPIIQSGGQYL